VQAGFKSIPDFTSFNMSLRFEGFSARDTMSLESNRGERNASHFPPEVICIIISFVKLQKRSQSTLHSCCLVSRSWYMVSVEQLYHSPVPNGKNYLSFIRSVCPPNVHAFKRSLSEFVKTLDLSALPPGVHESVAEQLLVKVGRGLEAFVAPDAEFS
jgi:hypothetical protein